jgi:hypothetical protein
MKTWNILYQLIVHPDTVLLYHFDYWPCFVCALYVLVTPVNDICLQLHMAGPFTFHHTHTHKHFNVFIWLASIFSSHNLTTEAPRFKCCSVPELYSDRRNAQVFNLSIYFCLYNGYRAFPGGKAARAWCWPPHPTPPLVPWSRKSRAIPLLPL